MILVTGASGFIGSVLAKRLHEVTGADIIACDYEKFENLNHIPYKKFVHADELFNDKSLFGNLSAIYHMGASSSTTVTDQAFLDKVNINYTKKIFELATKYKVKLCYASSGATYGDGSQGYSDDHEKIHELKPLNLYGNSKHVVDLWALEQNETPPMWFGVKFFNVYGPNEYHKGDMKSVVVQAFHQINETGKMKLFKSHHPDYKDGEQRRDFVYVKDIVESMLELMKIDDSQKSGIYNLGTGTAATFKELIEATFFAMNKEVNIEYIDMPEKLRGKYQYFTQADISKLKNVCPQLDFFDVSSGAKDYVENYLQKETPYY